MSILDDAIREHLELKRAHGADESELKKLEDEAFGPPGRPDEPDPFNEAPTEFLGAPAIDAKEAAEEAQGRRVPNIADLQEPPPPLAETAEESPADAEPAEGEGEPAMEHQTIPVPHPEPEPASEPKAEDAPPADAGPSTEERHAIADQPTEFFDVEAEMESGAEQRSPSDEQLLDSQLAEPRLAPVEPTPSEPFEAIRDTGPDAEVAREDELEDDDEDDDFFSEQRLSDELNQALEAPVTDEHEVIGPPTPTDEHEVAPPPPPAEEATAVYAVEEDESEEHERPEDVYEPETGSHDDVLEDTPDFLEEAPEDDDLWFEQKPPKDFDLD
ncbi:MAG TPA: hypothetical protein VFJ57_05935 [Solirubrobacterales bacterium]|nr:hypothetical protein [Solirubrobacterales bacterium]